MTYLELKSLINEAYADFISDYVNRKTLGADETYNERQVAFVKCVYKVLINQEGDELVDLLSETDIKNCIMLFNKYANATVPLEYT